MAINRRQFLTRSGLLTAGTLLGPNLFANPFVRQAMASTIGDRYLIVLFLDGGNDGLNTVLPMSNGSANHRTMYNQWRRTNGGGINISPAELVATQIGNDPGSGAQLALHPGLSGLKTLYDLGKVAVIQNCGYPDYSLSHEESRVIWQTANPLGVSALAGTGWLGRHLAHPIDGYTGAQVPGVTISSSVAPEMRQALTSVLAIDRVQDFGFPYDYYNYGSDYLAKRTAFDRLYDTWAAADPQLTKKYVGEGGAATLLSSESYPALHDLYQSRPAGPGGVPWHDRYDELDNNTGFSVGNDLREIAKVIYGISGPTPVPGVEARFFSLSNGGYDTHSDQGGGEPDGQHFALLREIGDSVKLFYEDLAAMGAESKVCIVVWSEFSRRIEQNDNGTDHGSQGPMFVIGGGVTGGVYGRHADLENLDGDGNTIYTQSAGPNRATDFRDVYGTILKHWVNMPQSRILADVMPLDPGDPATYWTSQNFDLGFLP